MKQSSFTVDKRGFTIVELLIVIVVIGILAAIVIVAFNGIQNRANDTAIKSDLKNIATIIEMQNTEKGAYPTNLVPTPSIGIKASISAYGPGHYTGTAYYNLLYCRDSTAYAIIAKSKSGTSYEHSSTYGPRTHTAGLRSSTESCDDAGVATPAAAIPGRGVQWLYEAGTWKV